MTSSKTFSQRATIILLDDYSDILEIYRRWITDYFGNTFELMAFQNSNDAINYIALNKEKVIAYVQDIYRLEMGDNFLHKSGLAFFREAIDIYTPKAKCLFVSGTTNPQDVIDVFKLGENAKFLQKSELNHSGSMKEILDWLVTFPPEPNDLPSESELHTAVTRLAPPWQEFCRYIASHEDYLHTMDPRDFEKLTADIFRSFGWEVELTAPTRDGGCDIIALRPSAPGNMRVLVEAKRYSPNRSVGVDIVRSFYGVKQSKAASQLVLVTSSFVTLDAKKEFSRVIPYELDFFERDKVLEWCRGQSSIKIDGNFNKVR